MNSIEYANARAAIKTQRINTQARLDALATEARVMHMARVREAATAGESPENEARWLIAMAVADAITIGRESDDYPLYVIPDDLKSLLREARATGVISYESDYHGVRIGNLTFHQDFSGLHDDVPGRAADCHAWSEADSYRKANKDF